jgi:small GTP-binding protein
MKKSYKFKTIILGEVSVGKTSLVKRYCTGVFDINNESTIGVSFNQKVIPIENCDIKLEFWDTAGQERFKSLIPMYFKKTDAVILVYDAYDHIENNSKLQSFEKIDRYWIPTLKKYMDINSIPLYLAANKCDLLNYDKNKLKIIKNNYIYLKDKHKIPHLKIYNTSALSNNNIDELFNDIAEKLYDFIDNDWIKNSVIDLDKSNINNKYINNCCKN